MSDKLLISVASRGFEFLPIVFPWPSPTPGGVKGKGVFAGWGCGVRLEGVFDAVGLWGEVI